MKTIIKPLLPLLLIAILASCASMEWVSTKRQPVIQELSGIKSLGIISLETMLRANEHLLVSVGGLYRPIEIVGSARQIEMLYPSPAPLKDTRANKENLAGLTRAIWAREIGSTKVFDYTVSKGFAVSRIMGNSIEGQILDSGYESVIDTGRIIAKQDVSEDLMKALGREFGVEAILAIAPAVYAEIGTVTATSANSQMGQLIKEGHLMLRRKASYEFALFETKAGRKIADSSTMKPEFSTMGRPEDDILDLDTVDRKTVTQYLNGEEYLRSFEQPLFLAMQPYLPLFRAHFLVTLQEAKKKP